MKAILSFIFPCLLFFSAQSRAESISITLSASSHVRHHDMWMGFFGLYGNVIYPTSLVFELKETEKGKFEGSIPVPQFDAPIRFLAVYAGGGTMYFAKLMQNLSPSNIRMIDLSHNGSSLEPILQFGSPPVVTINLNNGDSAVTQFDPIMVIDGLDYEETLEGVALKIFTHQLSRQLAHFKYEFAFDQKQ